MWLTLIGLLGKIPFLSMFSGLNIGTVLTSAGTFLKSLIANIIKYWYIWLIAALVAGNLFTSWEWNRTSASLTKEKAAHAADIASFKRAQAEADTRAQLERAVLQRESKANAAQADANYTGLLAQYHASLMRYSQAHRTTGKPSDNQLSTPEGGYGSSPGTDLPTTITISGDDAQICAVNTARLQAVHEWAINLPKDGESIIK